MNARMEFSSLWPTALGDASPRGYASIIQLEPDLGAFERVNVGVMVVSASGTRLVKVLSQFERLACLYGREVAELLEFMTDVARESLLADGVAASESVLLTSPIPFFNIEAGAYLDRYFAAVVPAAKAMRASINSSGQLTSDKLWKDVRDAIKQLYPERADDIIANTAYTTVMTRRGLQQICVPLTPVGGAGALESADFSPQTTQIKLMKALLDVEVAAESRKLPGLGFFIGRPSRIRDATHMRGLDKIIDQVAARVPAHGVVEVSDSPIVLARSIVDWSSSIAVH